MNKNSDQTTAVTTNSNSVFIYNEEDVEVLANALREAFKQIPDIRCLDWISYNPDFYRNQKK